MFEYCTGILKLTNRWLCGGCWDLLCIERIGGPELAVALGGAVLVLQSRVLVRAQELIRCRPRCQLLLLLLIEVIEARIELLLLLLLLIEVIEARIELLEKIAQSIFGFRWQYSAAHKPFTENFNHRRDIVYRIFRYEIQKSLNVPVTAPSPPCPHWPTAAQCYRHGSGSRETAAAVAAGRTRSGSPYSGCSRSRSGRLQSSAVVVAVAAAVVVVGLVAGWLV